jgi:hypothetical protein
MKTFNFTISCDLATAIINDDPSGLSDDQISEIESWYEKHNIGWINIVDDCELLHGTQCDITGLWSDCVDVIAYESVQYDMTPCKTLYSIVYDTEYGLATFDGEYESYNTFIEEANKAGREAGVLSRDESVLDCDHEIHGGAFE